MALNSINYFFIFIIISFFQACRSEYHQMEKRELAREERFDSLFLGLYLGMSQKDFYTHCWELNKKGEIREGLGNNTVYYKIDEFPYPAAMEFYPGFFEDKIVEMPVVFYYEAWAPWNRNLFSDSLQIYVKSLMEKWYGGDFIEVKNPKPDAPGAFVKIEGNRRISIYCADDSRVKVDIVDLPLFKKIQKQIQDEK